MACCRDCRIRAPTCGKALEPDEAGEPIRYPGRARRIFRMKMPMDGRLACEAAVVCFDFCEHFVAHSEIKGWSVR